MLSSIVLALSLGLVLGSDLNLHTTNGSGNETVIHHGSIHVASWRFEYVKFPFLITGFIIVISVVKIVFHHMRWLAERVPESCMLILLGVVIGLLFLIPNTHVASMLQFLSFNSQSFFLYLLPPIILESAYSLRDRAFVDNVGTILLFAVFGTILNIALVGGGLIALKAVGAMGSLDINPLGCFVFSSLIAAVDPVAVLAIFQEVGVNKMLYYLVFGESLFNDAVTVVAYNLMVEYTKIGYITGESVGLGFAAFLCVSLGGALIGVFCGFGTALITRFTSKIRVAEPTVLFGMAYLSYLLAEMVHFSGIISIICCGLIQSQYACENISSKSYISVHYFSKVASSVAESLIFIILGVMLVNQSFWPEWHSGFSIYSLLLCFISRYTVVFLFTFFVNQVLLGIRTISLHEQLVMGYGGLRGAVSFSLVFMLDKKVVPEKNTLMGAAYLVILFTVFIQGISMKPLVHLLNIRLSARKQLSVFQEMNHALYENILAGMEEIVGHYGTHYWTAITKYFSRTFLRPMMQKAPHKSGKSIVAAAQEISIQEKLSEDHSAQTLPVPEMLWDELQLLDKTALPHSFGDTMLDAQDEKTQEDDKVRRRKSKERPQPVGPKDLKQFKRALVKPFHKTVHYHAFDRNLRNDSSTNLKYLAHIRTIKRAYKKHSVQPGIMRATLMPFAAIGYPQQMRRILEDEEHHQTEQEGQQETAFAAEVTTEPLDQVSEERKPLFTSGPPV